MCLIRLITTIVQDAKYHEIRAFDPYHAKSRHVEAIKELIAQILSPSVDSYPSLIVSFGFQTLVLVVSPLNPF